MEKRVTKRQEQEEHEGAQFLRYFGPLLDALRKLGGSGAPTEVVDEIAQDLGLSEDARTELLDSGNPRFPNQVAWARFYLTREGLLDSSKRGVWSLTDKGRSTRLTCRSVLSRPVQETHGPRQSVPQVGASVRQQERR